MGFILIFATLAAGSFIGWSIGANDAANCVGADVGSRRMTINQAILITCVFSFLGAILMGHNVIKTVGKGIVPLDKLDFNVSLVVASSACFGAGLWVLLATYFKLPVSTSHSVVGAVAGAGLALGTPVVWKKLFDIFICWVLTPVGSGIIAFLIYRPIRRMFYTFIPRKIGDYILTFLIYGTSIYLAFTWGANDVANVTGVLVGSRIFTPLGASIFGGLAIMLGVTTWGYRVIQTVGFRITRLLPLMTVVAEIASSINIHVYTLIGIPVSTSHSIVGAVFGVGFARGRRFILQKTIIRDIILAWSITPFFAGAVSFMIMKILLWAKVI